MTQAIHGWVNGLFWPSLKRHVHRDLNLKRPKCSAGYPVSVRQKGHPCGIYPSNLLINFTPAGFLLYILYWIYTELPSSLKPLRHGKLPEKQPVKDITYLIAHFELPYSWARVVAHNYGITNYEAKITTDAGWLIRHLRTAPDWDGTTQNSWNDGKGITSNPAWLMQPLSSSIYPL